MPIDDAFIRLPPSRLIRLCGMQCGETKIGAVISGDKSLKWKLIWSQVQRGREVLSGRKDLPQRIPSTDTAHHLF